MLLLVQFSLERSDEDDPALHRVRRSPRLLSLSEKGGGEAGGKVGPNFAERRRVGGPRLPSTSLHPNGHSKLLLESNFSKWCKSPRS